nr:MAG TPA_asm: hypothetical protein [Caudoviricetes sp.]
MISLILIKPTKISIRSTVARTDHINCLML